MWRRRSILMGNIESSRSNGVHRVWADVAGEPLWFETSDCSLLPSVEGFTSALLFPALARRARIHVCQPVDGAWLRNVRQLVRIWHDWWGCPRLLPRCAATMSDRLSGGARTALCFTGGIDSFHTLLHTTPRPQMLVFVHGYDVPLNDRSRAADCGRMLQEVAQACAAKAVVIRTNLRTHPVFRPAHWERAHGGALAAVGHLLGEHVGRLIISSSFPHWYPYTWGTHPLTDHWWSSSRVQVAHVGATHSRLDKIREIAGHPLAQAHVRVCWENRASTGNCSQCDKCLCTMVLLEACGALGAFPVFEGRATLAERLQKVPRTRFVLTYGEILKQEIAGDIREAVQRLLERTNLAPLPKPGPWSGWKTPRFLHRLPSRLARLFGPVRGQTAGVLYHSLGSLVRRA